MFDSQPFASSWALIIYFLSKLICFFWICNKYKYKKEYLFFILLWFPSIFETLGPQIQDYYYAFMFIYGLFLLARDIHNIDLHRKTDKLFIIFTIVFFFNETITQLDNLTTIMSQYSRYFNIMVCFILIKKEIYSKNRTKLRQFIYHLLLIQIIISIVKLFTFKWLLVEGYVGSLANIGGAYGTTIPILGIVFLSLYSFSKFKRKEWLYTLGLLLLGILAGKRAVIFILPGVIVLLLFYLPKLKMGKELILGVIMIPLFFYFGVRLNFTLNPEHKVWGSFDLEYVMNYADDYQFGKNERNSTHTNQNIRFTHSNDIAQGRGGTTLALLKVFLSPFSINKNDIFGYGFHNMYGIDYPTFLKLPLIVQINHKGSATGFFQSYVTLGYIGTIISIIWFFSFFFEIKHKRFRNIMILITAWDYFFYNGMIIRTPALMIICAFSIYYSNWLYENKIWLKQ